MKEQVGYYNPDTKQILSLEHIKFLTEMALMDKVKDITTNWKPIYMEINNG